MARNVMRFDPFGDLMRIDPFRKTDEILREFALMPPLRGAAGSESASLIRIDISETDKAYVVKADMPGANKEDIKVAVDRNQVSISAQVKKEKSKKSPDAVVHSERPYGQLYRSFVLPQEVDDGKAEAKYADGVLLLSLPKKSGNGGSKQLVIH